MTITKIPPSDMGYQK